LKISKDVRDFPARPISTSNLCNILATKGFLLDVLQKNKHIYGHNRPEDRQTRHPTKGLVKVSSREKKCSFISKDLAAGMVRLVENAFA
jgi:hypothetical protein